MVSTQHHRANFAASDHGVELERDLRAAGSILIEDARLRADHQVVPGRIADPRIVVPVLKTSVGIDAFHGRPIGLEQVFAAPAQADPAKGAVAVVKHQWSHDIFHV